ncbi:Hypp3373 [Branchiostoma lanceolatum]|uniref:Hypp3373 protein n=1 Tax=Branchiostoma lanceolatum TaxID=7740 RepID=A0A8K0A4M7_BRALA|nr:Hypp3373 [Branchiostoma lanceolatum]
MSVPRALLLIALVMCAVDSGQAAPLSPRDIHVPVREHYGGPDTGHFSNLGLAKLDVNNGREGVHPPALPEEYAADM